MPKQRDVVKMTDAEIEKFFGEVKSLNVATLNKDGAPHLTTLWFSLKDGNILFETYGTSQKVVNLRRDPRVAVLSEAGDEYSQLRGVSITGQAEIVDREPRLSQLMGEILKRNHPGIEGQEFEDYVARMVRKRVVVVVRPEKVMSWDHRKLGATAAP
ncbi:MAG: TIGR03618 family F420-dependent PPOX class oxidoreductase [Caulobacteraceae bacterium]|nr:TIGR03618 family F420-dependent PPOX class oxidoreductase [Caulobacteraceae bacterium]